MNKEELIIDLQKEGVPFTLFSHKPVYTVEEAMTLNLPLQNERGCRNLFLRDEKKRYYCLIFLSDNRKIDLKEFSSVHYLKRLSFASSTELESILGVEKGSVTPLSLINDSERRVNFFIDETLKNKEVFVHPMKNDASILIKTEALIKYLENKGIKATFF